MNRIFFLLGCLLIFSVSVQAQQSAKALEETDSLSLQARFNIMKSKSESYTDYKVIRTYVLDGMWKMTMDSLRAEKASLREAHTTISKLENELKSTNETIKQKDDTIANMEHDTSHIKVVGIDVQKTFFLTLVGLITLGLLVFVGLLILRIKWIRSNMREKIETAEILSREFEEYKRNALDKQMKLSRELQDERNKLQNYRGS